MVGTVATVIATMIACAEADLPEPVTIAQGVQGTVTLTPGHKGDSIEVQADAPDLTPRPLPNATVYLIKRDGDTAGPTFVDSTLTDSLGRYHLNAPSGLYYVAVGTKTVAAPVLVSLPGDTARSDKRIHALAGLVIVEGHLIEQPLNVEAFSVE